MCGQSCQNLTGKNVKHPLTKKTLSNQAADKFVWPTWIYWEIYMGKPFALTQNLWSHRFLWLHSYEAMKSVRPYHICQYCFLWKLLNMLHSSLNYLILIAQSWHYEVWYFLIMAIVNSNAIKHSFTSHVLYHRLVLSRFMQKHQVLFCVSVIDWK